MASIQQSGKNAFRSLWISLQLVGVLWIIQGLQWLLHAEWGIFGIYPREIFGLRGVVLAPLIHANFGHLLANTPPLFVLSAMVLFFYRRVAAPAMVMIYLLTGLAVWTFARPVFHIGASGVVYGLVAFVFWNGIFRRNIRAIALALIVVFYYGSMFMGILPGQDGVSWESHLLGGLAGIFTAYWFKNRSEKEEIREPYSWEKEEQLPPGAFFDPDVFDKTKAERRKEREDQDNEGWFRTHT
ncbi:MAG: rhomboid family intramembrane serine protease [Saprospiraceae bacterium]|jgi:membrane associated rhomboid family serine protease|nr:rhomboid family intramembrane serine protease [Saprospiraceae bacterium]